MRREIEVIDLFGSDLRDFPILTKPAVHVTPGRGQGKSIGPGQEMEERFLLDRIDVTAADFPVDESVVSPADIFSDSAVAAFPIPEPAFPGTDFAFDFPVRELSVIAGFDSRKLPLDRQVQAFLSGSWKIHSETQTRSRCGLEKLPPVHQISSSMTSISEGAIRPVPILRAV
jgi:hypothetical protein